MKTWWLILRNDHPIGAAETEGEAVTKFEQLKSRLVGDFVQVNKNIWRIKELGEIYSIVEVTIVNKEKSDVART